MTKHTAGPWKYVADNCNNPAEENEGGIYGGGWWVAKMEIGGEPGLDSEANARLIASAPDMYEALLYLSEIKGSFCIYPDKEIEHVGASVVREVARRALQKAEGD
jgi:hypothetical protein